MTAKEFQLIFYVLRLKHPKCLGVTARIPLAQGYLESSGGGKPFNSNLALTAHNIFGMQYPAGRALAGTTTATGKTASGFASYRSFYDCIEDYFYWLENWKITTDAELDDFVAGRGTSKYAEDPKYYPKLMGILTATAPLLLSPALFAAATLGAGLGVAYGVKKLIDVLK